MCPRMPRSNRREFLQHSAAALALSGIAGAHAPGRAGGTEAALGARQDVVIDPKEEALLDGNRDAAFVAKQEKRRKELWALLGDLPTLHAPGPAKLLSTEQHEGYTLERLVLDLNGIEPVPALLLIPHKRQPKAPGLLYIHWHGGMYDLGKEQLLKGVDAQPAYAPVCAEKGLVTLAIDSWCFGERKHVADGGEGEQDAFQPILWRGQVLYGVVMFGEFRGMGYLARRPGVDSARLGA